MRFQTYKEWTALGRQVVKGQKAFIVFRPYRAASVDGGKDIIKSYKEANEVFEKVLALNRNAPSPQ